MSITDELREWAKKLTHWWYDPVKDEYTYTTGTMPPSIDAIRMDSNIIAIADRIDVEHESACAEAYGNGVMSVPIALDENAWVELPKDADGEYIHVGDVMEWCDSGETLTVEGIGRDVLFYIDGENAEWTAARNKRHHHEPTVEDVLREFADEVWNRCCEGATASDSGIDELVAECAAKLRLAGENA